MYIALGNIDIHFFLHIMWSIVHSIISFQCKTARQDMRIYHFRHREYVRRPNHTSSLLSDLSKLNKLKKIYGILVPYL